MLRYATEVERNVNEERGEREETGQRTTGGKCIVGDILRVHGPRHGSARCSDAHNGRDVHLPQEPIIRYGGRSLYVPPLSLARIAYGPLANSFLFSLISPPASPFCPRSPRSPTFFLLTTSRPGQNHRPPNDRSRFRT